jgi:hypothetical protein
MRTLAAGLLLSLPLAAQLPTNTVLVLEAWTPFATSIYRSVDIHGGGGANLPGQGVFTSISHASVSVDPVDPHFYFYQSNVPGAVYTSRVQFGPAGGIFGIEAEAIGPWYPNPTDRIEVGDTQVFALWNGNLMACDRLITGLPPTVLLPVGNAIDLATQGTKVWIATYSATLPAPILEYDTVTATQRIVGNHVGMRAIAVSPAGTNLSLGMDDGSILEIDISTGQVQSTQATGLGPIRAIGYASYGSRVWADAQQVWSEIAPAGPIHVSSTGIVDLAVSILPTASVTLFGQGCGIGATAYPYATELPLLGNPNFAIRLYALPTQRLALLALGTSRFISSVFGTSLPFDLQPFGASGCALLVDPELLLAHVTDAWGMATQVVPIPTTPALAGVEFFGQWFLQDATVGPLGLASAPGIVFVVQ